MAPLISETSAPVEAQSTSATSNPHNKWSCHSCTYLNWPKATKCTQCSAKRKTLGTETSNYTQQEQTNKASDATTECVLSSDNYHNDRNKSWSRSIKWTCATCTYENWPKSTKVGIVKGLTALLFMCLLGLKSYSNPLHNW